MFQPGDKVRFLNESIEGEVIRKIGGDRFEIVDKDGFTHHVGQRELVAISFVPSPHSTEQELPVAAQVVEPTAPTYDPNHLIQYFEEDGTFRIVPGIEIPIKGTDRYYQYKKGKDRLDKLSQEYYGTPVFGWLILQANPLVGSVEFEIADNSFIRIPFPLVVTLQDYKKNVDLYTLYYGKQ